MKPMQGKPMQGVGLLWRSLQWRGRRGGVVVGMLFSLGTRGLVQGSTMAACMGSTVHAGRQALGLQLSATFLAQSSYVGG